MSRARRVWILCAWLASAAAWGQSAATGPRAVELAAAAPVALPVSPFTGGRTASTAGDGQAHWEVRVQDVMLSRTIERWAADAGYRLKWDAARNFLIGAPDLYAGDFEAALQAVLGSAGIRDSDYPLEACVYANTPPLVRITRQGEQSRECHAS